MTSVLRIAWAVNASLVLLYVCYRAIARKSRGPLFPPRGECQILFRENCASGRSLQNLLTRSGARNCMKLIVTPDELWTTLWFPLSLFAELFDLEHRIKKQDIVSVRDVKRLLRGRRLEVVYTRDDGRLARLELAPWRFEEFKRALAVGMDADQLSQIAVSS